MHPKFTAFIEKITGPSQQDITDALQRLFAHAWLAWIRSQSATKVIHNPKNTQHRIMVWSTLGQNPLTYVEPDPQNPDMHIIGQVCIFPKQHVWSLNVTTVTWEQKGKTSYTQDPKEIMELLDTLHGLIDTRSQGRIIDLEVLPEHIDTVSIDTGTDQVALPTSPIESPLPPSDFTLLFEHTAHIDATPVHPAIDIRQLIAVGHIGLNEIQLTELEITAMQTAANKLYQEITTSAIKQPILPPVLQLVRILTQDNARPQFISVFLSVVVETIDDLTATNA